MRKAAWWIGGLGLLAVGGIAAAVAVNGGNGGKAGPDGKGGKPEVALEFTAREVVRPTVAPLPVRVEFSGPLVAPSTATVRAKAPGTLLSLQVAEGSRVHAGQVLGQVDLAELGSRVEERRAMLESARAQLAQAERTHDSNQRLADQKFISPNALDASRSALDTARAQLRAAEAQLNSLRVSLRDAALVSPIDGLVAKRHVVPGEKLAAEQPLLTIVDLKTLELAGSVGTHQVSMLTPGLPVEVRVEGVEQPVAGRIARIAPAAEPGTRSIGVTITLPNPKEALRAGQYAMARVQLPDPVQRLTLPAAAIGSTSGQEHVWVIEKGALARRIVTTGRRDGVGRVEVVKGLAPDAQVLAARFDNLREGGKAVVVDKAQPVASAAASTPTLR
jgi:RND family efflux transporter MFP subunit